MRIALMTLSFLGVMFAGCAGDSTTETEIEDTVNKDEFSLGANLGAIAGLLVDDRFRPIDLEDEGDARGEFQAAGFILLQETGERRLTNENGEFSFVDLEPGTYTLRVSATGHEATPQRVQVTAGEFAEQQIIARRKATDGGTIISEEYSAFVPCAFSAPIITANYDCTFDMSGDSSRSGFTKDFQQFGDDITYIVNEMRVNQRASTLGGAFKMVFREQGNGQYYAQNFITEGDYMYLLNKFGEPSLYDTENRVVAFINDRPTELILFPQGGFKQETQDVMNLAIGAESRGLGAQFGVRAQFVQTTFLGEPTVDISTFAVLNDAPQAPPGS